MIENFRIQVFRAVAEQANFRKASEQLHLSQPAVSQHIHALEEELGLRLFDRGGNRIRLTAAGTTLLKFARKAAALDEQAQQALANLQGETGGDLRLGASTTVAQYILPRILGSFLQDNPRVNVSVVSGNTEKVVSWVVEGSIGMGMIEGPALRKDVHTERFLRDRMVLIAAKSHEWSSAGAIAVEALAKVPLLLREQGSGSRRVVETALRRAGLPPSRLRVLMELDSTEAIVSGVEAGLGVGFVSQWAIGKEVRLGTVTPIRIEGLQILRDFSLVRPLGPAVDGPGSVFRRFALAQDKSGGESG
jgi:DNA-binding transcriptional LysR family regulator